MTDERMDPRFEAAVRTALTELEPGEVPAALRAGVGAVPRRAPARSPGGVRLLAGLGAIAASVAVAVVLVGLVGRLAAPALPVAASPSAAINVPAPAQTLELVLVPVDPAADLEAIAAVLARPAVGSRLRRCDGRGRRRVRSTRGRQWTNRTWRGWSWRGAC